MQRGSLALVIRKEGPMFGSFVDPRRICMELVSKRKRVIGTVERYRTGCGPYRDDHCLGRT